MSSEVIINVTIDDTKVHVITRAQRLRDVAVTSLTALREAVAAQVVDNPEERDKQAASLTEAINWLNELEV